MKDINKISDIVLSHIIENFGEKSDTNRTQHYSYCMFPEEECECRDLNNIGIDTQLITGGYMDSFSMVTVLVFLESTFNINIPDSDASPTNFNTVNKITELVKKYTI